ncbi:MAG TPA: riboflavin biosynthesis protein RibF [Solirubrobacterales bacterium]|nr:riboflavin biosynthesis protein RibF [Solirubrobacterales bacterium]
MSIKVTPLEQVEPRARDVAIGTFDGVHLGHRAVIDGSDTVLTFEPHPLEVLRPEVAPKLINSLAVKRDVLDGLGVEELVVIHFDEAFSHRSAENFIDYALVEKLGARRVAVGENFHFGAKAKGNPAMLAAHPEFDTRVQKMIEVDGAVVSSSRIRGQVEAGDMVGARRCLGVPYMVEGEVVGGDRRGRELGFPTANLLPDERLVTPAHGVYAAFADGHPAAVNIGTRPTFDSDRGVLIETHLIDFSGDLYGRTLRVAFVERLRPELAFDDVDALVAQMHADVEDARRICADFTEAAARGG